MNQLSKTKSSIEESLVMEFGKQTELLETQIQRRASFKNKAQKLSVQEVTDIHWL